MGWKILKATEYRYLGQSGGLQWFENIKFKSREGYSKVKLVDGHQVLFYSEDSSDSKPLAKSVSVAD